MKNLIGVLFLGGFLYVVMGGSLPNFTNDLEDKEISYDNTEVNKSDIFIGVHVKRDENGTRSVSGISQLGTLFANNFFAGLFKKSSKLPTSYLAKNDRSDVTYELSCGKNFADTEDGSAADLLSDLCITVSSDSYSFGVDKQITRGDAMIMLTKSIAYLDGGNASIYHDGSTEVPSDVNHSLYPYIAQLYDWGLGDLVSRDAATFGANDPITTSEVAKILSSAVAILPSDIVTSDSISVPLQSNQLSRGSFASMIVSAFAFRQNISSGVVAVR